MVLVSIVATRAKDSNRFTNQTPTDHHKLFDHFKKNSGLYISSTPGYNRDNNLGRRKTNKDNKNNKSNYKFGNEIVNFHDQILPKNKLTFLSGLL